MEMWKIWTKRFWWTLGASGVMFLISQPLHADGLHNTVTWEPCPQARTTTPQPGGHATAAQQMWVGFAPVGTAPAPQPRKEIDWQKVLQQLQSDWDDLHEVIVRTALEMTMTMGFGWYSSPPTDTSTPTGSGGTPPGQTGGGGGTTPPPPDGQGEPPPFDPPPDLPPSDAPEPSSTVSALLGVGIASLAAWRKRRKKRSAFTKAV